MYFVNFIFLDTHIIFLTALKVQKSALRTCTRIDEVLHTYIHECTSTIRVCSHSSFCKSHISHIHIECAGRFKGFCLSNQGRFTGSQRSNCTIDLRRPMPSAEDRKIRSAVMLT